MLAKPTDIFFRPRLVEVPPLDVTEFGARRALIVAGVMMAALLQTLDATIVNVALPTIEGNIGASIDEGTWIITGYIISNVVAIPLAPFFLRRFGRRQYFATCVIGFTVASVLCGTASTLTTLVLWRVVQGAFGGGLIATSQIILRDTLPEKARSELCPVRDCAHVRPGARPDARRLSHGSVFVAVGVRHQPGSGRAGRNHHPDHAPQSRSQRPTAARYVRHRATDHCSGIACNMCSTKGERNDWFDDGRIVFFTATCVVGLAGFVVWELRGTREPIVDLRLFRYGNVRVGALTALLLGMVIFGPDRHAAAVRPERARIYRNAERDAHPDARASRPRADAARRARDGYVRLSHTPGRGIRRMRCELCA
jgi:DHA2 family multidrug resistance protein